MNYDTFKPAIIEQMSGYGLTLLGAALLSIAVVIFGLGLIVFQKGKTALIVYITSILVLVGGIISGNTGVALYQKQHEHETARFSSWVDKNYDLNLTKKETKQLEDGAVVKDYNGQLQKLTLEEYKDGVVVMNDGKAIKQK
jgi:ABC-type bacteriocin/lantibiotic exporter with double-glycine peptidase domain